jgi:hypothetical protein
MACVVAVGVVTNVVCECVLCRKRRDSGDWIGVITR